MAKIEKTPEEKARSLRSYAIAAACLGFVVLVFFVTVLRIKDGVSVQHF